MDERIAPAPIAVVGATTQDIERLVALDDRLSTASFVIPSDDESELLTRSSGLLLCDSPYLRGALGREAWESAGEEREDKTVGGALGLTRRFLELGRPILAYGFAIGKLNEALGGSELENPWPEWLANDPPPLRNTIFLTIGSKVAMTIGGSGWLTMRNAALAPLTMSQMSPRLMPAAITDESKVAAFEEPGHRWTIGVSWDITRPDKLPAGFGNIFEAFVDRTIGSEP